ncbi:hypothetical protein O4J55_03895 [Paracoccus sp. PXZ]|uniref:hypothetical protein n=1 Tax=Paracoccus sp. MKU1 TaxID=1745182 RepID=UPI0007193778|nr:hypothetical protein [Paracoccus sp. MKU1]KRW96597.1 hypothetical protein AQY21_08280 [Paracoccus sp. MKU1]
MRPALLRLDSFSSGPAEAAQMAAAIGREEAFRHGYEKGLEDGREISLDALTRALAGLRQEIQASQEREAALRRDVLGALTPVLHAIVDLLGPRSEKERLRVALAEEVARIVEHAPERALIVRCPGDLHPDLADCLDSARFPQVRIENLPAGRDMVELVGGQGTITFDPSLVTTGLKAIIDDIETED